MGAVWKYFWNILISFDQFVNTLLGGVPDETLSSRMGKHVRDGRCKLCFVVCWFLDKLDPNHCHNNIEEDEGSVK